jgi:predicted  nucleic acid-binding Zn-ribbon protein
LLVTIENNEKRSQLTLRDRERALNDEKTKLNKRADQLTEELAAANEKVAELKMTLFES